MEEFLRKALTSEVPTRVSDRGSGALKDGFALSNRGYFNRRSLHVLPLSFSKQTSQKRLSG